MRKWLVMVAACLFGVATPASAAFTLLTISGTVTGERITVLCTPSSPPDCLANNSGVNRKDAYSNSFTQAILPIDLKQGDNDFSYGSPTSGGLFTGIINYNNGVLTGRDLYFSLRSGVSGSVGSSTVFARAGTFAVTAVPEPVTWALMLIGFLVVGSALRQAPRRALLPA